MIRGTPAATALSVEIVARTERIPIQYLPVSPKISIATFMFVICVGSPSTSSGM